MDIKIEECTINKDTFSGVIRFAKSMDAIIMGDYSRGEEGILNAVKKEITDAVRKKLLTEENVDYMIDKIDLDSIAKRVKHEVARDLLVPRR